MVLRTYFYRIQYERNHLEQVIFDNYPGSDYSVRFLQIEAAGVDLGKTPQIAHRCFLLWRKPPPVQMPGGG
jgi:hypothetical protein